MLNYTTGFSLWGVYRGGGFKNLSSPLLMLHSLVLGSLLAAVDPVAVLAVFDSVQVNEMLYIIVFGESLLNDGISVVSNNAWGKWIITLLLSIKSLQFYQGFVSPVRGFQWNRHWKYTRDWHHSRDSFILCHCFWSHWHRHTSRTSCRFYIEIYQTCQEDGTVTRIGHWLPKFCHRRDVPFVRNYIVCIFCVTILLWQKVIIHFNKYSSCTFCGITMRKYVEANFTEKSNKAIHIVLKMFAQASETIVFMYIGMSAVSDIHQWDTAFCLLTLVFCLIFRTVC